jgi:hypothetical protein
VAKEMADKSLISPVAQQVETLSWSSRLFPTLLFFFFFCAFVPADALGNLQCTHKLTHHVLPSWTKNAVNKPLHWLNQG